MLVDPITPTVLLIDALIAKAREAEREACAKIAESWPIPVWATGNEAKVCVGIAKAIREGSVAEESEHDSTGSN